MRQFILALVSLILLTSAAPIGAESPPNVILILTDNHGAWTLGCYGNPDIRTPNIDRLADEGTLFTRAFASNPVCSPTRASLLTGLVPSQHGVHSFLSGGNLQTGPKARNTLDEFTSLPEILDRAGYNCGLVGKWHLGANLSPQEKLDDYWITMPHGGTSTFYDAPIIENGKIRKEPTYLTDFWTDHALKFIDGQVTQQKTAAQQKDAEGAKPFFLFLSYNGPYSLGRLLLRDGKNRHVPFYADKEIKSFPRTTPHPWQLNNLDYINNPTSIRRVAAEVSGVDDGVGEILSALKQHGLDDNTVILFVADQGWVGGHGGFFGMGDHTRPLTARDGMMQIPMIWRHPGKIRKGIRSEQMIANYDVLPTMLGHLGITEQMPETPKSPGHDLSGLLSGKTSPKATAFRDAVFYEFENLRCIRTTTHKYVHRHPNGPHELYDLENDPEEFNNLLDDEEHEALRRELKTRLDAFYTEYRQPKYDMWHGGTSQVRIHDGVDEELAQLQAVEPPTLPKTFNPAPINVPEGYSVELAAGPPLVTHPTMGCFDDEGSLYVCNNAGVNMTNEELEKELPNAIRKLVDSDNDGRFDSFTVFADKMTFPMGGVFHDGSLFVASPPNIWRLTDTDGDGVADQRKVIVSQFGYNGNAASIHGCFLGPDGRIYWTDGYHGHEFKDDEGNVTSQREGSYLFSCMPDGSDKQIHCGGGMDNPVEIDFTDSGDMLGTVNILYTRPRVDCLVHWLHGGVYPHRERVLSEVKTTGEWLTPAHRFGHVAISGFTRYRSGVMDHRFGDHYFATFFNGGKVVRLETQRKGSTYSVTQHEFLSSPSREFHPTDVLEDADGSLLVIDTGGWFYRGCPTSQFAKPDVLGGIYRIRRDGMTTMVDPRGKRIQWENQTPAALMKRLNDTRHEVRAAAINEAVRRGNVIIPTLKTYLTRGDIRVRQNAVWALVRLISEPKTVEMAAGAVTTALSDAVPSIRQTALQGLGNRRNREELVWVVPMLKDNDAAVRRQAAVALGKIGDSDALDYLVKALDRDDLDREEEHAIIYAMIEIGDAEGIRRAMSAFFIQDQLNERPIRGVLTAIDQIDTTKIRYNELQYGLMAEDPRTVESAAKIAAKHPEWESKLVEQFREAIEMPNETDSISCKILLSEFVDRPAFGEVIGRVLSTESRDDRRREMILNAIISANQIQPHESWINPISMMLQSSDNANVKKAIQVARSIRGNRFNQILGKISKDESRSIDVRMDALAAVSLQTVKLDESTFQQLIGFLSEAGSPTAADRAAQMIGSAKLTTAQLSKIAPLLESASPAQLRDLIRGFGRRVDPTLANDFLTSIGKSESLLSLAEHELSDVIKRFPSETLSHGNELLDKIKTHQQAKIVRLESLRSRIPLGDAERGAKVFASEKAKCSSCHRIGRFGKAVGPDLTTIGNNRSVEDLLESIVFPSASIVRDYGTYKVLTADGRVVTGLLVKETANAIEIQQANGEISKIVNDDIEQISPSAVSTMPAGLDEALTEQQLLDVVRYLQTLRADSLAK